MVDKINSWVESLRFYQIALIFGAIGILVFGRSLVNGFVGDDFSQIVNNPVIHSLSNLPLYFQGGTFYVDGGIAPLYGVYYRPMMTTVFAIIYSIFGQHAFYFHLIQLLFHIGCAVLVFLIFRLSVRPAVAFLCAVLFLVHPLNSQNVYAIASMQEVLMGFFGLLGIWLLTRYHSRRSLFAVALCFLLALLSKESAVLFILLALGLLALWDRERLPSFAWLAAVVSAIWFIMRVTAVGFFNNPHNAPITDVSFGERLLTMPSVFSYYILHFIAPAKISAMYYWTVPSFSISQVLLPLLVIVIVGTLLVWLGYTVYKRGPKTAFYDYLFYAAWFVLGYGIISQIHALDMTACPSWFYIPSIGLMGMLAVGLSHGIPTSFWRNYGKALAIIAVILVMLFSARTFARGFDWRDEVTMASRGIKVSSNEQDNFNYAQTLAVSHLASQNYSEAENYASRSVKAYPMAKNTFLLGKIQYMSGKYAEAHKNFELSTKYQATPSTYEYMALCLLYTGQPEPNRRFYDEVTKALPTVANLWQIWAVYEYTQTDTERDISKAKELITQALKIDPNNQQIISTYNTIMSGQSLTVN